MRPHRWQPTRLPHPWDSSGKNTGVGCHFLLQCMKVEHEVMQSCPTLRDPTDCSLPGSSVHGIFQARVLEWGTTAFSDDKPRQCIKKQRHHFANKGLYSQGYGFSSSHVWMWELDCKEGCSVQFSYSVVSDSLWSHGLQHARPPCPSPTPRVYSNSRPLSQWCHLTISSSVIPFSFHLKSFPASGCFQMNQFFASGGQSISSSFSISASKTIQD